jgi:anti-anti-sigma factor
MMPNRFRIREKDMNPPVAALAVHGRLDAATAKELRTRCTTLADEGYTHIILDMAQVTFIASSGAGALIVLSGEMNVREGTVTLVALSQAVARVIDLLNLERYLDIEPDEATARAGMQTRA